MPASHHITIHHSWQLYIADEIYIIIPAVNVDSCSAELCSITDWACKNNLKLNLAKSQERIFVNKRRKANFSAPTTMPELKRVQVQKR